MSSSKTLTDEEVKAIVASETADLRALLGQAEAAAHAAKQDAIYNENVNADFYDMFKAHSRYATTFRGNLFYFINKFHTAAMTIDNAHGIIHQRKWPPLYVLAPVILLGIVMVAILAYPPYGFAVGAWFSVPANTYSFMAMLGLFTLMVWFISRRRKRSEQQ